MDGGDATSEIYMINNHHKPGPAIKEDMVDPVAHIGPGVRKMCSPARPGKWCVAGNIVGGQPEVTADTWKGLGANESVSELARMNTPFTGWPVRQETALQACESVLSIVGATLPQERVDYLKLGNKDSAS
jgi:pectate lyase